MFQWSSQYLPGLDQWERKSHYLTSEGNCGKLNCTGRSNRDGLPLPSSEASSCASKPDGTERPSFSSQLLLAVPINRKMLSIEEFKVKLPHEVVVQVDCSHESSASTSCPSPLGPPEPPAFPAATLLSFVCQSQLAICNIYLKIRASSLMNDTLRGCTSPASHMYGFLHNLKRALRF